MCQAPLFLPLFSMLPSPATFFGRLISIIIYTALDLLSADCLYEIAASGVAVASSVYTSPRKDESWKSVSVAAVYLLNPFTLLTCLARPTTVFTTFFVLLSIRHATQGKPTTTAFALALASYTSLHPLLLLPPIGLLCYDQIRKASTPPPTKDGKAVQTTDQQTTPLAFTFTLLGASSYPASSSPPTLSCNLSTSRPYPSQTSRQTQDYGGTSSRKCSTLSAPSSSASSGCTCSPTAYLSLCACAPRGSLRDSPL
jgi:hypothetical protein